MPAITIKRGNLNEHDPWQRHRLPYGMGLWSFAYDYAVNTMDIDQEIDGVKTFYNFPVLPVGFPIEDAQAANKFYVDYISRISVTCENLFSNGDVGIGVNQVAQGDHGHENLPTDDQKDALDTAQDPDAANPFVVYAQFESHANRHESSGADEIDLSGLSGGPITINGIRVKITNVSVTPYLVLDTDVHISVDSTVFVIVIQLPVITNINHGQRYTLKDGYSNASINSILITPSGSDQVDNGGAGISFDIISNNEVIDIIANNLTKNWEIGP